MDLIYSQEISPSLYQTDGLDNGTPLRMHNNDTSEIRGALRAQRDWNDYVAPIEGYKGGLGEPYSFIRVTVPECLPDRLEIISYANEFAFLYDSYAMENLNLKNMSETPVGLLDAFCESTALEQATSPTMRPEKVLQAKILSEMMSLDKERAITSMKAWASFVRLASRTRTAPFATLEEYLPVRIIDAGELIWFGTLTFGMALTIPEDEYELCMELARPGYAVLGLTNDLYSWEKERREAQRAKQEYVFNAVWVLMQERSVDEEEAKAMCAAEIRKHMAKYCQVVDVVKNNQALSKDVRAYMEAVRYSCVGNLVWSIYCPRYREF